jgi:membrane-associated protein
LAGVGKMNYRVFVTFNLIGALLWAVGVTMLGYYLGNIGFVKRNLEIALVTIVALSLIPVAMEVLKHRREKRRATAAAAEAVTEPSA